jgi:DNA/RNA non-specific endonuclease
MEAGPLLDRRPAAHPQARDGARLSPAPPLRHWQEALLQLQRQAGNRAVAGLLTRIDPAPAAPVRHPAIPVVSRLVVQRVPATQVNWTTTTKTDTVPVPPALAASNPPTSFTLGHVMDADPLSSNSGGLTGSKPKGTSAWWPYFQARHLPQNQIKDHLYWVQGHLLNDNLHGPGDPYNLVPLSNTSNTNMETKGERSVKQAIQAGKVVHYRVEAVWDKDPADRRHAYGLTQEGGSLIWGEQFAPTTVVWSAVEKREQPPGSGNWVDMGPLPQPELGWYNTFPQPVPPDKPMAPTVAPPTAGITVSPFKMPGAGGVLTVAGKGFSPNGRVSIVYLNVPGHEDRSPRQTEVADGTGSFTRHTNVTRGPTNTDPTAVVPIAVRDDTNGWHITTQLPVTKLWI